MVDRETVIKGLEHCIRNSDQNCYQCPYSCQCEEGYYTALKEDALELLKDQEPIEPIIIIDGFSKGRDIALCGNCKRGVRIGSRTKGTKARSTDYFCGYCGRPVKWD